MESEKKHALIEGTKPYIRKKKKKWIYGEGARTILSSGNVSGTRRFLAGGGAPAEKEKKVQRSLWGRKRSQNAILPPEAYVLPRVRRKMFVAQGGVKKSIP